MKLGRTTKFGRIFFIIFLFSLLLRTTKFGRIFLCLRLIIHHSRYPSFIMVQPVSAIFILIGLGFRFYSRQSIIYGSTRPPSFSLFVPAHCASSTSSSIHPSISSSCFDILSTTVSLFVLGPLGCAVYPMLTVGVTCTQLSRLFYSVLGVPRIRCSWWV
jgi:hypothetical protein